jgi:precorrin-6B methylase 2
MMPTSLNGTISPGAAQQQTASDKRQETYKNCSGKTHPENRVVMWRLREEMMHQVREGQRGKQHSRSAQYVQNSQGSPPRAQSYTKAQASAFVVSLNLQAEI